MDQLILNGTFKRKKTNISHDDHNFHSLGKKLFIWELKLFQKQKTFIEKEEKKKNYNKLIIHEFLTEDKCWKFLWEIVSFFVAFYGNFYLRRELEDH